jgi:hypothetical protein
VRSTCPLCINHPWRFCRFSWLAHGGQLNLQDEVSSYALQPAEGSEVNDAYLRISAFCLRLMKQTASCQHGCH